MLSCKILIIDDDEDDIGLLSDAFSQCGVDGVHYVFSAIKAFMYLEEVEQDCLPKLIVTDLYLPGMSGAEFLTDLKNMEKYQHIHVVVLSTNKNAKEIEKYQQMGALDYLIKPSTFEEYVQVASEIRRKAAI
jgi:CheY-like chemotaxis protein